jgi:hypothetical protein
MPRRKKNKRSRRRNARSRDRAGLNKRESTTRNTAPKPVGPTYAKILGKTSTSESTPISGPRRTIAPLGEGIRLTPLRRRLDEAPASFFVWSDHHRAELSEMADLYCETMTEYFPSARLINEKQFFTAWQRFIYEHSRPTLST